MFQIIKDAKFIKYMALFFVLSPYPALAEGTIPATDKNIMIKRDWDLGKSNMPEIQLFYHEINGVAPGDITYSYDGIVCLSNTNPEYGSCVTNYSRRTVDGISNINLQLTERRSGMKANINLTGYASKYYPDISVCNIQMPPSNYIDSPTYLYSAPYAIQKQKCLAWDGRAATEITNPGWALTIKIPQGQNLPVGGVWEGNMILKQVNSLGINATWKAHLQFDVTDTNHIDIYFPEFGTAAPLVPLNIHPTGGASPTPGGQDVTNLDMCLYDGFNVNSSKYEVLLEDGNHRTPAGRPMGWFSVYRDGGDENQPRDRIDYQVRMNNPETDAMMDVRNGELITWNAVNTHRVRPVRLPSISYPVLCAPTPLEFRVNKFATADKNAGQYHGTLRVTFTPTTTTL